MSYNALLWRFIFFEKPCYYLVWYWVPGLPSCGRVNAFTPLTLAYVLKIPAHWFAPTSFAVFHINYALGSDLSEGIVCLLCWLMGQDVFCKTATVFSFCKSNYQSLTEDVL